MLISAQLPTEVTAHHINSLMEKWASPLPGINITHLVFTALLNLISGIQPKKNYKSCKEENVAQHQERKQSREPDPAIVQISEGENPTKT